MTLQRMDNVLIVVDAGTDRSVTRQGLEVSYLDDDGATFRWLGHSINIDKALNASKTLFAAIQSASMAFTGSA